MTKNSPSEKCPEFSSACADCANYLLISQMLNISFEDARDGKINSDQFNSLCAGLNSMPEN